MEKFDPGRLLPDRRPGSGLYFPFGAGPRTCMGNHLALQELIIMTAPILKRLRVLPQPELDVQPDALITLRPKHGMMPHFEERFFISSFNPVID